MFKCNFSCAFPVIFPIWWISQAVVTSPSERRNVCLILLRAPKSQYCTYFSFKHHPICPTLAQQHSTHVRHWATELFKKMSSSTKVDNITKSTRVSVSWRGGSSHSLTNLYFIFSTRIKSFIASIAHIGHKWFNSFFTFCQLNCLFVFISARKTIPTMRVFFWKNTFVPSQSR